MATINYDFYFFSIMFSRSLLSLQLGFRYRNIVIVNPFQESNQAAALFNFVGVSTGMGRSDSLRPERSRNRISGWGDFPYGSRQALSPECGADPPPPPIHRRVKERAIPLLLPLGEHDMC